VGPQAAAGHDDEHDEQAERDRPGLVGHLQVVVLAEQAGLDLEAGGGVRPGPETAAERAVDEGLERRLRALQVHLRRTVVALGPADGALHQPGADRHRQQGQGAQERDDDRRGEHRYRPTAVRTTRTTPPAAMTT